MLYCAVHSKRVCDKHSLNASRQASELVKTDGWNKGNLEEAIQQAYMNLDAILGREDAWDELSKFASQSKAGEKG